MPLIFVVLLFALPALDVYATLRFAEALGVPGVALFIPGLIAGVMIMKREASSLRSRLTGAIQSLSLHAMVFDSGRKMLAALLLLLPGFVSDVFALFLLLIPNRSLAVQGNHAGTGAGSNSARVPPRPNAGDVVDAEYRRVD